MTSSGSRERTTMKPLFRVLAVACLAGLVGCGGGSRYSQPMAPPVAPPSAMPVSAPAGSQGVYNWQEVPQGQQVPVSRAVFDQAGYQVYAASGETIVVPFVNQNLYAMKFGRSNTGQTYFVNEGDAPVLYLRDGDSLENAAAQGARWYPISPSYTYT